MATKFIVVRIEIMHDKNLTPNQKFILAEIEQLEQLDKGCIASNKHFSDLIGIAKENVSRSINDLKQKNYINIEIINGSRNHTRVIKTSSPPYQNVKPPLSKRQETKENKTINKTLTAFEDFLKQLRAASKYKTKVTKTTEGEQLFKEIKDKGKLFKDYLLHQEDKKEFSIRITAFMLDYETVYNNQEEGNEVTW